MHESQQHYLPASTPLGEDKTWRNKVKHIIDKKGKYYFKNITKAEVDIKAEEQQMNVNKKTLITPLSVRSYH